MGVIKILDGLECSLVNIMHYMSYGKHINEKKCSSQSKPELFHVKPLISYIKLQQQPKKLINK